MMSAEESEKLVRRFYESTAPGHREALRAIQASHVVYDLPDGMPAGAGHFEGLEDVLERFLTPFYGAFDVHFAPEEFIVTAGTVVVVGRIEGRSRKTATPVRVAFVHIWTVADGHLQHMRGFTDTAVLARALAGQAAVFSG